jgi:hypothetical protein
MNLPAEVERAALQAAEAVGDGIAHEATWLCLDCESVFPGYELFTDEDSQPHRRQICPTCGSSRIVIPERID